MGMTAGDEAPRGAAAEVNEMYVDTRQLVRISLMTECSRGGRGAQKVARAPYSRHIKAKRRKACVITHRSATAMVRRRRPPACAASHPHSLQKKRKKEKQRKTHTALLSPFPLSASGLSRLWRNWPGAYLNTFQLFRGSRSEIIETMVDWLGSTGRGRGCG